MIPQLFLLLVLLVAGWALWQFIRSKARTEGTGYWLKWMLWVGCVLLIVAVVSGRAHFVFGAISAAGLLLVKLLPWVIRSLPFIFKLYTTRSAGASPRQIRTRMLLFTLNHATGKIDGRVLGGDFAQQLLSAMNVEQLQALYTQCLQQDPAALHLLLLYAQRERPEWQVSQAQAGGASGAEHSMLPADAAALLGVDISADVAAIRAAHKDLIARLHPDRGGTDYLAMQINRARDVLLKTKTGT